MVFIIISRHLTASLKPKTIFLFLFFFLASCASLSEQNREKCEKINSFQIELIKNAPVIKKNIPDIEKCDDSSKLNKNFIECFTNYKNKAKNDQTASLCLYGLIAATPLGQESLLQEKIKKQKEINNLNIIAYNAAFPDAPINFSQATNSFFIGAEESSTLDETLLKIYNKYNNLSELKHFSLIYSGLNGNLPKLEKLLKEKQPDFVTFWVADRELDYLLAEMKKSKMCVWDSIVMLSILKKRYYFNCET